MLTTLETLRIARAGINPSTYAYYGYSTCTCGHIYRAVDGIPADAPATKEMSVRSYYAAGDYERALLAVAEAAFEAYPGLRAAFNFAHDEDEVISSVAPRGVSYLTRALVERGECPNEREAALRLLDLAIAREERLNEQARLDVLAQLEAAVGEHEPEAVPC